MKSANKYQSYPYSSIHRNALSQQYGIVTSWDLYNVSHSSKNFIQRLTNWTTLEGHTGCVNTISWNSSGSLLLSGSDDYMLNIYHVYSHKMLHSIQSGHHANIFSAKFLPCTSDMKIVSCSGDGMLQYNELGSTHGGNFFNCHSGTTYEVVVTPGDPNTFLSCGEDGTIRMFDLRTKTKCHCQECREDILIDTRHGVTSISTNPLSPYHLAAGCKDSYVCLFDCRTLGTSFNTRSINHNRGSMAGLFCKFKPENLRKDASCRITSVQYSNDGRSVLVSYCADYVYTFSVKEGEGKYMHTIGTKDGKGSPTDGVKNSSNKDSDDLPPVKRLRLRGDWSDTGPSACPETTGDSVPETNLMQRMSVLFSAWLEDVITSPLQREGSSESHHSSDNEVVAEHESENEGNEEDNTDTCDEENESCAAETTNCPSETYMDSVDENCNEDDENSNVLNESNKQHTNHERHISDTEEEGNKGEEEEENEVEIAVAGGEKETENEEEEGGMEGGEGGGEGKPVVVVEQEGGDEQKDEHECKETVDSAKITEKEDAKTKDKITVPGEKEFDKEMDVQNQIEDMQEMAGPSDDILLSSDISNMTNGVQGDKQPVVNEELGEGDDGGIETSPSNNIGSSSNNSNIDTAESALNHSDEHEGIDDDSENLREKAAIRIQKFLRQNRDKFISSEENDDHDMNPVFMPTEYSLFKGHRNARTMIKEANFWGEDYILSGSDCGRIFIWDRHTGDLIMLLQGDSRVVNCVQPHPFDPILASSGIDHNVKIWAPLAEELPDLSDMAEIIHRNEQMLEKSCDTITVPASFVFRMLASFRSRRRRSSTHTEDDGDTDAMEN